MTQCAVALAAFLRSRGTHLYLKDLADSRIHTGNERRIVFLGANLNVPEEIEGSLQRLNPDSEVRTPPRLRDGRWVS